MSLGICSCGYEAKAVCTEYKKPLCKNHANSDTAVQEIPNFNLSTKLSSNDFRQFQFLKAMAKEIVDSAQKIKRVICGKCRHDMALMKVSKMKFLSLPNEPLERAMVLRIADHFQYLNNIPSPKQMAASWKKISKQIGIPIGRYTVQEIKKVKRSSKYPSGYMYEPVVYEGWFFKIPYTTFFGNAKETGFFEVGFTSEGEFKGFNANVGEPNKVILEGMTTQYAKAKNIPFTPYS